MLDYESSKKQSVKICLLDRAKDDLKNITDNNKEYGRKQGWKNWASTQNQHLRAAIKNCCDRVNEQAIAFMRDDEKSPVYAFHIQNPTKTKNYYLVCVLKGNILEGNALFNGSSLFVPYVITNNASSYLNAIPNPDHQLFIDNKNLIEPTDNDVVEDEKNEEYSYTLSLYSRIKQCYENHKRVSLPMRQLCHSYGYVVECSCVRHRTYI